MKIVNVSVSIGERTVVDEVSISCDPGSVHVLMGPNGSGKSSLAYALSGHPAYIITSGSVFDQETDILTLPPEQRARAGLFLVLQYPIIIPGLSIRSLLIESYRAMYNLQDAPQSFMPRVLEYCQLLGLDHTYLDRPVHEGFSGGEKKRIELLQAAMIQPKLLVLDEIDSGLDTDGLRSIALVLRKMQQENPQLALLIITHYQRILEHITPDQVHVLYQGNIVARGDYALCKHIEHEGFAAFAQQSPWTSSDSIRSA